MTRVYRTGGTSPSGPQRLPRYEMPQASFLGGVGRKLPLVPGWQP
jgi:hypothetical protein